MSKTLLVVVALGGLTLATRLASADDTTPGPPGPKSPATAVALSAGGTALSLGLLAVGVGAHNETLIGAGLLSSVIAPSAGQIYAGKPVTAGMGIRAASAVVGIIGIEEAFKCFFPSSSCENNSELAVTLMIAGATGYGAGVVYDLATAGTAAEEYNRKFNLRVAPTVLRTASSGSTVGLGFGGSF